MKRKISAFILALTFLFTIMPIFTVSSADTTITPYSVGTTASGTRIPTDTNGYNVPDVWYSVQIDSDGLYKVSHFTTTNSNYKDGGGGKVYVYDKTGTKSIFIPDAGYEIIPYGRDNVNTSEANGIYAFIHEYAVYLHKGAYLLREYDGRGTNNYSFKVEKIASPYGEDKETNDTTAGAVSISINGTASGVLGGVREDMKKDIHDFYVITIPEPMKCNFQVIGDRAPAHILIYNSLGTAVMTASNGTSTKNEIEGIFKVNYTMDFKEAGTYYIRISTGYYNGLNDTYTNYTLTLGGEEPKTGILYGDVNGDGKVNIADLILLSRWLAGFDDNTLLGKPKP